MAFALQRGLFDTGLPAQVGPAGRLEWPHDDVPSPPTANYAEFGSTVPGPNFDGRDPHAKQLTAAEAPGIIVKSHLDGREPKR